MMSNPLRLCLDLNIWCAALLADIKGNQNSACQSIVDTVRYGRCYIGTVELVISWGMLNRLEQVLLRLTPIADDASFYVDVIRSYSQIQPQLILGGTGTIPIEIREQLGLTPNTEVEFEIIGDAVYLKKAKVKPTPGQSLVEKMRGKATVKMTTDEIMALTRKDQ